MLGAGVRVGACMLYGGIKIEEEQSIIVIVDEQNKLFIQHDIVIDNTESGIKNFLSSMQQGGIKPTDIYFAISPGHIKMRLPLSCLLSFGRALVMSYG